MNLWQRGSRFTFQKRVPSDLVPVLGATPIRLPLPCGGRRQADRLAALLGGTAEATFQQLRLGMRDTEEDARDIVIRELQECLREAEHALADGRRFRALCIVDDFTREALAVVVDTSSPGIWTGSSSAAAPRR